MYKKAFARKLKDNKYLIHLWEDQGYSKIEWDNQAYIECDESEAQYTGLNGEPLKITGDGSETRPFTYVLDIVNGIRLAMDNSPNDNNGDLVYNIGTDNSITILELAEKINDITGNKAGIGLKALDPVTASMSNPLKSKTITLSCGKLTTGVTVKPWTGVMMLRNSKTPETYFQTAFRVQSPWTIKNEDNTQPNNELVLKKECYVFDFAPNRFYCIREN